MKYLFMFEKGEGTRWLGHLDIMRAFERAIRRSEIPVAFSEGFNPHVRLSFASALGVGVTGGAEQAIVELTEEIDCSDLTERMNAVLPAGLRLLSAVTIPDAGSRDILNRCDVAEMRIECEFEDAPSMKMALLTPSRLMNRPVIIVRRERDRLVKDVDVRRFILSMSAFDRGNKTVEYTMFLTVGQEGSIRPQEISALLTEECGGLAVRRIHRERLIRKDELSWRNCSVG